MSVLFSFLFFSPHKTGHLTKGKKMYCEILSWRKKGKWQQENSQVKESFYWHSCTFKQKLDLTNTSSRICHLLQGSSQNTKVKMSPACEDGFTPLSRTRFDVSRQSEGLIYWKSARRFLIMIFIFTEQTTENHRKALIISVSTFFLSAYNKTKLQLTNFQ